MRGLLALLALKRGQRLHREEVIEHLWPALSHKAALNNLNFTVFTLRRALGPELKAGVKSTYIHDEQDHFWLGGPQQHWVDLEAFERLVAKARQGRDDGAAFSAYRAIVPLDRGDFMADIPLESPWFLAAQDRLRELFLAALDDYGDRLEMGGDLVAAGDVYRRALTLDPCREAICHRLMELTLRLGERLQAIAAFERLAEALAGE